MATMELLPLQKWCIVNGIPSDIVQYIVCGFYQPLVTRYIGEKISIMKMCSHLDNPNRCLSLLPPFGTRWPSVLRRRLRMMDMGVVDSQIEGYIRMIDIMIDEGVITTDEVLHIIEQGIREDHPIAFKVIYKCRILDHFPHTDAFIRRASEKYSALVTWQVSDIEGMTPLVKYYLDKQMDEPLLEWLTVWRGKGLDIYKSTLPYLTNEQKIQMEFKRVKQQSSEMRRRRMNSFLYNVYSDQVLEK